MSAGGIDWLTILTGLAVLAAIALAFWVVPSVRDAFEGPFGDVPGKNPATSEGLGGGTKARRRETHTRQHGGKRNNR